MSKGSFYFPSPKGILAKQPLWECACVQRTAISGGTPVAGVALRPLNKLKSLLEAGMAGSRFRIPDTYSARGGTTPGRPRELGQVALA